MTMRYKALDTYRFKIIYKDIIDDTFTTSINLGMIFKTKKEARHFIDTYLDSD